MWSCSFLHGWCTQAQKHHPHFQIFGAGELISALFGCPSPVRGLMQGGCVPGAEWRPGWAPRSWSRTPGVRPCLLFLKQLQDLEQPRCFFIHHTRTPACRAVPRRLCASGLARCLCPAGIQVLLLTRHDCGTYLGSCEREGTLSSALTWCEALSRLGPWWLR